MNDDANENNCDGYRINHKKQQVIILSIRQK